MSPRRRERRVIAVAGAAALVAVGLNLAFSAVAAHHRRKRRELPGFTAQVNLSAAEIKRLADRIITKSKNTYDSVAAVPLDKVSFSNVIAPLAELDALQFPLVQACVLPRMVSTSEDVRRASAEAQKRLDCHFLLCRCNAVTYFLFICLDVTRQREDVYRIIKAFMVKGERIDPEATRFVQCLVKEFERNGVKLTQTKRKEMDKLRSCIEELNLKYIQNMSDFTKFLVLTEDELAGMPIDFLKVQLRHRLARLLGYPNYSDFAIEPRMPKTSRKVLEFLEEMSEQLNDVANRELNILKELKMKEEGNAQFGMEDLLYYIKRAEEFKVDLDIGEIKQYFPASLVISGMLKMFQDLFALRFEEIKDADVWHDTVRVFSVWDASSSDLLGYFFLDIYARFVRVHASKGPSCRAIRATYSRFSGLRLEGDFAEIPSLLLENWCYESVSLKMMSGFHQVVQNSAYDVYVIELLSHAAYFSWKKRCLVDQIIHSSENVDIDDLIKDLHPKVMSGLPLLEGTSPASCFPRITIGYDAVCYSYIWSEVFAADLFVSKFKDDLLNQHAGLRFRNKVLAPGGSKDPLEIITNYLGREPSLQPFIQSRTRNSL
ncbi:hypothetical protein PR202_ga08604 [Eleusine coracana subsp. coracana]|uniref:Peptidase M3A/M3B catalytic domain-containing protein n=1 Tax=Eleusine coracana subsp. coracana TaxID=191504 RepID=A0AAV5C2Z2_ELECO|nr:hypothetical protein PR202_ga08604 [Eleusine coracana subsp. coracana]